MTKKLFLAFLFLPFSAVAQVLTPKITAYIDSALHRIRMTRSDMCMRWDVSPDDPYRLPIIKRSFADPLSTIPLADSLAHALPNSFDSPRDFVNTFAAPLNVTLPQYDLLPKRLTKQEMLAKYNVNTDALSPHLRAAIIELLSGIAAADTLMRQARAVYTPEEFKFLVDNADTLVREDKTDDKASLIELKEGEIRQDSIAREIYAIANRYPRELTFKAAAILMQSVNVAKSHIAEMSQTQKDTLHTMTFISSLGKIAIGGMGADVYDGDYICIIDLGGDDIYRRPNSNKISALATPASVILDMGGNDYYEGGECSFASGYFGVSILDDVSGDDIYNGGNFSLGAGFFGAGILLDEGGDDKYIGGTFVEGCGAFGFGALIDKSGNDTYLAQIYSQGFGFTYGFGAIVDENGNDTYTAAAEYTDVLRYDDHFVTLSQGCGLGYNPIASGGIGIISERGGNDTYSADIYGQACGYWYSFGAIVDDGGNDRYNAFQYAQGAGIHRAFGVLIDKKGDDYYSSHGVSQGCGHDVGFGALLDLAGDDFYNAESLSLGAGNANAISLFCDAAGNDAYIGKNLSNTFGYSDDRSGYGMIGIFLDLGGHDEYPTYNERNNSVWTKSFFGVGIDADVPDIVAERDAAAQHREDSIRAERDLGKDIKTLFIQSCAAPQKFQYLVEPSRKKLVEEEKESLPYLLTKLSTTNAREFWALAEMLQKMKSYVVPFLIDSLRSPQERTVGISLYVLGKIGDSIAAPAVLPMLHSPVWRIRASAAEQLGLLKDTSADATLADLAKNDTVEIVRMRAMRSLGELKDADAADEMIAGLTDKSQLVRNKANEALNLLGEDAKDNVMDSISDANGFQKEYLIELLVNYPKDRKVKKLLSMYLRDDEPSDRRAALTAIEKLDDKGYASDLKKALKAEESEPLRGRETALLEKLAPKKKNKD